MRASLLAASPASSLCLGIFFPYLRVTSQTSSAKPALGSAARICTEQLPRALSLSRDALEALRNAMSFRADTPGSWREGSAHPWSSLRYARLLGAHPSPQRHFVILPEQCPRWREGRGSAVMLARETPGLAVTPAVCCGCCRRVGSPHPGRCGRAPGTEATVQFI